MALTALIEMMDHSEPASDRQNIAGRIPIAQSDSRSDGKPVLKTRFGWWKRRTRPDIGLQNTKKKVVRRRMGVFSQCEKRYIDPPPFPLPHCCTRAGDFKAENLMFTRGPGGLACAAVDFQYCGRGPPMRDVAYLLHTSTERCVCVHMGGCSVCRLRSIYSVWFM
jgi:hypothetical protein